MNQTFKKLNRLVRGAHKAPSVPLLTTQNKPGQLSGYGSCKDNSFGAYTTHRQAQTRRTDIHSLLLSQSTAGIVLRAPEGNTLAVAGRTTCTLTYNVYTLTVSLLTISQNTCSKLELASALVLRLARYNTVERCVCQNNNTDDHSSTRVNTCSTVCYLNGYCCQTFPFGGGPVNSLQEYQQAVYSINEVNTHIPEAICIIFCCCCCCC